MFLLVHMAWDLNRLHCIYRISDYLHHVSFGTHKYIGRVQGFYGASLFLFLWVFVLGFSDVRGR